MRWEDTIVTFKKCKYKDINQNNLENKQTQKIHVRDSETQTMEERTV